MAPRLEPPSLLLLAHRQVAQNLANICRILHTLAQETCVTHVLNLTRNTLRPVWQSSIPACIRAQLLEETTKLLALQSSDNAGSVTGAAPLYLLVLLLAKDIKKIRIELCCYYGCSHQTALLKFLATEGKGLQSLELARSTLLRLDRTLLQSVLMNASSLRYLTFKNIANDNVLQIIGAHCPNLVFLDVSHSKEVTDAGLKQLFLRIEIRDKSRKSSQKLKVQTNIVDKIRRNIYRITKYLHQACLSHGGSDSTTKELMNILEYCELRNSLCSTLKVLNIANTGVTNAGILFAILHVPDLESLGEYCHIGRALELLEQTFQINTLCRSNFQLKCVNSSRTTPQRLQLISDSFPQLRKLKITEPMFPPKLLFVIPFSVVTLSIQSVPSTDQWLESIFKYLNGPQGQVLEELSLRFFPGDILPDINLVEFLPNCRNLRVLNIDGANICWNATTTLPTLPHLQKIQLGKVVMMNVINELLMLSPALTIVHIYSCHNLQLEDIFRSKGAREKSIVKNSQIQCFYVYETVCLDKNTQQSIISTLPSLRRIGNIKNCSLSVDEIHSLNNWIAKNNFNVELSAGSHWFSSSCFPL